MKASEPPPPDGLAKLEARVTVLVRGGGPTATVEPCSSTSGCKPCTPELRAEASNTGSRARACGSTASSSAAATLPSPSPTCPQPLGLVHEDTDILVVHKPTGLLTIATEGERTRTAYRLLRDWVVARGSATARLFIVHRLDRETSGLIVFAKSVAAKRSLQAQFAARAVERVYVALVEGAVRQSEGSLTARLTEDRALRVRTTIDRRAGREAITRYRVLERRRDATLPARRIVTRTRW